MSSQTFASTHAVDQKAFSFLELPSELRNQIYGYILVPGRILILPMERRTTKPPHLTQVCAQIRCETLPLYYKYNTFGMDFTVNLDRTTCGNTSSNVGHEIVTGITHWATLVGAEQLKHLRNLGLCVVFNHEPRLQLRVFSFKYSPESGLKIDANVLCRFTEYRKFLDDHQRSMENLRKVTGQQGEAIIMAMLARPQMWDCHVLIHGHAPKP